MLKKIKFWLKFDRIGLDVPFSWILYSNTLFKIIYQKKFYYFGINSEIRRGANLVNLGKISIGERVVIRPGSHIYASAVSSGPNITIGNDVLLGSGVHIYTNNHKFRDITLAIREQGWDPVEPVIINEGAWIGAGCLILPGVTIGRNAVVGAGSVVTKSIPDFCVAVGNPARVIKNGG